MSYKRVKVNVWHDSALQQRRLEHAEPCVCKPASAGGESCSNETCMNRAAYVECNPAKCPCGSECGNCRMQRGKLPKTRVKKFSGKKGSGVIASQDIPPGTFIAEYLGEIITLTELERRMRNEYKGMRHTYIMTYLNSMVIDATARGGEARFINHSCDPNCETQKWIVKGETKVGIFSVRRIAKGEEICYNYRLEWNGFARTKCECGAKNCVGWLGGDKQVGGLGGELYNSDLDSSDNDDVYQDDDYGNLAKVQQFFDAGQIDQFASPVAQRKQFPQAAKTTPSVEAVAPVDETADSSEDDDEGTPVAKRHTKAHQSLQAEAAAAAAPEQPVSLAAALTHAFESCSSGLTPYPSVYDTHFSDVDFLSNPDGPTLTEIEAPFSAAVGAILGAAKGLANMQTRQTAIGGELSGAGITTLGDDDHE